MSPPTITLLAAQPTTGGDWSLAVQDDPEGNQMLSEREAAGAETWAHVAPALDQVYTEAQVSLIALGWG